MIEEADTAVLARVVGAIFVLVYHDEGNFSEVFDHFFGDSDFLKQSCENIFLRKSQGKTKTGVCNRK